MKTLSALAALSLALAAPVRAELSHASVETSGFSYELVDLDDMDGIIPAITFSYDGGASQSYGLAHPLGSESSKSHTGYGMLENEIYGGSARAESGIDFVKVSATAWRAGMTSNSVADTYLGINMTPNTAVIFHVPYELYATISEPGSFARASLLFTGAVNDGFALYDVQLGRGATSGSFTGRLTSGSDGLVSNIGLTAGASVAVVPEPATYAMLLAGLAVLGGAGLRGRGRG
jgi:hypothetical protein